MLTEQNDKELWNGIKNNDQDSLTKLFQRYYFYLIKIAFNYSVDAETARDAISDIFYNLWQSRQFLSNVDNVKAYITTSFRNHVSKLLQQNQKYQKRLQAWQQEQEKSEISYEDILTKMQANEGRNEKLKSAFARLTPKQKEYLQLKFYDGFSYEQIAEKSGQTIKTIYNTVYEAIKMLRQEIRL